MICSEPGECNRVSCSYGTGVAICASPDTKFCITCEETGFAVDNVYHHCGYDGFDGTHHVPAMQVWKEAGNVLIKGGYDC